MKNSATVILLLLLAVSVSHAQMHQFTREEVRKLKLTRVVQSSFTIDSKGAINLLHPAIETHHYDTSTGHLVEKRQEYSADLKQYVSTQYVYGKQGLLLDSVTIDPFAFRTMSIQEKPDSGLLVLYAFGRTDSIVKWWKGGVREENKFNYGEMVIKNEKDYLFFSGYEYWKFLRDIKRIGGPDCPSCRKDELGNIYRNVYEYDLLSGINIYNNGKLVKMITYQYDFGRLVKDLISGFYIDQSEINSNEYRMFPVRQ